MPSSISRPLVSRSVDSRQPRTTRRRNRRGTDKRAKRAGTLLGLSLEWLEVRSMLSVAPLSRDAFDTAGELVAFSPSGFDVSPTLPFEILIGTTDVSDDPWRVFYKNPADTEPLACSFQPLCPACRTTCPFLFCAQCHVFRGTGVPADTHALGTYLRSVVSHRGEWWHEAAHRRR